MDKADPKANAESLRASTRRWPKRPRKWPKIGMYIGSVLRRATQSLRTAKPRSRARTSLHGYSGRCDEKGSPGNVVPEAGIRTDTFQSTGCKEVFGLVDSENEGRRL